MVEIHYSDVVGARKFVEFLYQKYTPHTKFLELVLAEFEQLIADEKGEENDRKT